jgi:S-adenosylmethionine:diacylglycerol 3-amino-3-carboxypropyl transferase
VKINRSKVASAEFFSKLGYSTCWEDPVVIKSALAVSDQDNVLSVTSGGDLSIGFLLDNPLHVVSIDLNTIQNFLLELKLACFRELEYPEMLSFLGIRPCRDRFHLYEKLESRLTPSASIYWSQHRSLIENGVLLQGKQDRYFFHFGKLLRKLLGSRKVETLLKHKELFLQKRFYDHVWNSRRWRWIFNFFFSRTIMSRYMDSAHFRLVKDLRFGPLIRKQVDHVLRNLPIRGNYFVYWVLTKSYPGENCMPPYLQENNFDTIRQRVDRISIVNEEIETFLCRHDCSTFSKFNLSNIFDWIDDDSFIALLREISKKARPNARLCYYNLLSRRVVPYTLIAFKRKYNFAMKLLQQNRAMGYTNFELYEVNPDSVKSKRLGDE